MDKVYVINTSALEYTVLNYFTEYVKPRENYVTVYTLRDSGIPVRTRPVDKYVGDVFQSEDEAVKNQEIRTSVLNENLGKFNFKDFKKNVSVNFKIDLPAKTRYSIDHLIIECVGRKSIASVIESFEIHGKTYKLSSDRSEVIKTNKYSIHYESIYEITHLTIRMIAAIGNLNHISVASRNYNILTIFFFIYMFDQLGFNVNVDDFFLYNL